jgi:predicted dehydrogenase/nucleoside-diphosphate-sugar epimerase
MMSRRWIITGANGYLGGELCRILHRRGENVTGAARAGRPLNDLADAGIPCVTYDSLPEVLSAGDVLVHCAGMVGNSGSIESYLKINRDWSLSLFDQASAGGAECFIYVSSVAATGYMPRPTDAPLDESSPPDHAAGDLYGRSKLAAEEALKERSESSPTRLVILRPGLIYGRKTLSSEGPDVIDPGQRIPLVHIDNFADALVGAVTRTEEMDVFIVVDEEQPSLRDLNALKVRLGILSRPPRCVGRAGFLMMWIIRSVVRTLTGRRGEVSWKLIMAEYYFQTRRLLYSTKKLRARTGWTPAVSLERGLEESRAAGPVSGKTARKKWVTPAELARVAYNRLTLKADRGPTGIGLTGVGGWGSTNAANIMRSRRFNIVGIFDQRTQAAERFAGRFGTKCYDRIEELLEDSEIQAVAATIPNQFHADVVKAAADAGKHIFMEKPLAVYPETCRELGQYCRERGVILQVGHQLRREPVFREIKRIVEDGSLGRPLNAQAVYTLDRRARDDWRRDAKSCPGGSMEQLGAHIIDVLIYLFGNPVDTEGWAENIPTVSDSLDWGCVMMTFNNDIHAAVSTSFSSPQYLRLEIHFDGGTLATDGNILLIERIGSKPEKTRPRGRSGSVDQFIEFAGCIESGGEPETGAEQAAAVMDVVGSISCCMEMDDDD